MKTELSEEVKASCLAFAKNPETFDLLWWDATSYSKGERGIKPPNSFEITVEECRVYITCGHIYAPGEFVFHCYKLGFDTYPLKTNDARTAAISALNICARYVQKLNKSFQLVINSK